MKQYTMAELEALTGSELVDIHNKLAKKSPTAVAEIGTWKQAKSQLISRIVGLGYTPKDMDEAEKAEPEPKKAEPEPEPKPEPKKAEPTADKPEKSIKDRAIELLCEVDYYEDRETGKPTENINLTNVRSVGLSYKAIVERIREEYPEATTSVESLRWYSSKIRTGDKGFEDITLPQKRPQQRKKKEG